MVARTTAPRRSMASKALVLLAFLAIRLPAHETASRRLTK
jgi:hypothetical protein